MSSTSPIFASVMRDSELMTEIRGRAKKTLNVHREMLGTKELLGVKLEITVVIQTFCRLLFNKTLCF